MSCISGTHVSIRVALMYNVISLWSFAYCFIPHAVNDRKLSVKQCSLVILIKVTKKCFIFPSFSAVSPTQNVSPAYNPCATSPPPKPDFDLSLYFLKHLFDYRFLKDISNPNVDISNDVCIKQYSVVIVFVNNRKLSVEQCSLVLLIKVTKKCFIFPSFSAVSPTQNVSPAYNPCATSPPPKPDFDLSPYFLQHLFDYRFLKDISIQMLIFQMMRVSNNIVLSLFLIFNMN